MLVQNSQSVFKPIVCSDLVRVGFLINLILHQYKTLDKLHTLVSLKRNLSDSTQLPYKYIKNLDPSTVFKVTLRGVKPIRESKLRSTYIKIL